MKKLSEAAAHIITGNPLLHFGLHHRLLNLSQVARFIRPLVEARTHKEVSDSAVLMSLSRLQNKLAKADSPKDLVLDKINIHSGLCSLTVFKTPQVHKELSHVFGLVHSRGGFITITEGINEITAILQEQDFEYAKDTLSEPLRHIYRDIASVGVRFNADTIVNPGVIYRLVQQVALQNINIIEISSTATEFNIYVRSEDVRLTFDSIYQRFSPPRG